MMPRCKTTGLVLDEKPFVGGTAPADTFVDRSRHGNNGTHTDITWVQNEKGLWVRSFNGSISVIALPNEGNFNFTGGVATVSFWFLTSSVVTEVPIAKASSGAGGWQADINDWAANKLSIWIRAAGGNVAAKRTTNSVINDGKWHKADIGMDFAVPDVALYIDGSINQGALTSTAAVAYTTQPVKIGARFAVTQDWFSGSISSVRIYSYALSAAQIRARFEATRHWYGV